MMRSKLALALTVGLSLILFGLASLPSNAQKSQAIPHGQDRPPGPPLKPAEAVQKTVLSSIPLIQLSGFIYPVRSMPAPVRVISQLIPATHFIEVSRAIYLRGEGFFELWPQLAIIFVMGVALMAWALRTLEARS